MTTATATLDVKLAEEVRDALASGRPVVALESTIIAHGLPYPDNIQTAKALEDKVRNGGAVPATIAVLDGIAKAGLSTEELDVIAQPAANIAKLSRRDLAFALSQKRHGATTVAATMIIAEAAGIEIFATGGIGGVHRGAETNFDISADLPELARTNVAVICAGPKAILDIGLTMEYLETYGVPVIGYRCDSMPAFYSARSAHPIEMRLDDAEAIARLCWQKWHAGLDGGVLVANPIPPAFDIPYHEMAVVIEDALAKAQNAGISGKALTPFLLAEISNLTHGESLSANKALVENNVSLATEIACHLAELKLARSKP